MSVLDPRNLWFEHVSNNCGLSATGLTRFIDILAKRCCAIFGHVARLEGDIPANVVLCSQVYSSLGGLAGHQWSCRPDQPYNRWLDQVHVDSRVSLAELWRHAVQRGWPWCWSDATAARRLHSHDDDDDDDDDANCWFNTNLITVQRLGDHWALPNVLPRLWWL